MSRLTKTFNLLKRLEWIDSEQHQLQWRRQKNYAVTDFASEEDVNRFNRFLFFKHLVTVVHPLKLENTNSLKNARLDLQSLDLVVLRENVDLLARYNGVSLVHPPAPAVH